MTSQSHYMTQTKQENRQIMETKDTRFCEESFIDVSFLVLEIFGGSTKSPATPYAWTIIKTHGEQV